MLVRITPHFATDEPPAPLDSTERRITMRRIKLNNRSLVVSAVMLATALLAAAFPLVAWAGDGHPFGS